MSICDMCGTLVSQRVAAFLCIIIAMLWEQRRRVVVARDDIQGRLLGRICSIFYAMFFILFFVSLESVFAVQSDDIYRASHQAILSFTQQIDEDLLLCTDARAVDESLLCVRITEVADYHYHHDHKMVEVVYSDATVEYVSLQDLFMDGVDHLEYAIMTFQENEVLLVHGSCSSGTVPYEFIHCGSSSAGGSIGNGGASESGGSCRYHSTCVTPDEAARLLEKEIDKEPDRSFWENVGDRILDWF